jgi:hypothetical protein
MLTGAVLVAFIHHILIFHPFNYDRTLEARGPVPMYDFSLYAEFTDDQPDMTSLHNRRGATLPILSLGISAFCDHLFHQLLLNAAVEHPPKA